MPGHSRGQAREKEAMRNRTTNDTDDDEESMSTQSDDDTTEEPNPETIEHDVATHEGILNELAMLLPGDNPLEDIHVVPVTTHTYTAMSTRDGSLTTHRVNVADVTCTCPDYEHNVYGDENREICAHLAEALLTHPHPDVDYHISKPPGVGAQGPDRAPQDRSDGLSPDAQDVVQDGEDAVHSDGQEAAEEAADRLQSAYDETVDDMRVTAEAGRVWVQTGPDTPETLSGPGNVSPFQAFLQNADQVEYIHENHELHSEKPGEWWKNAIEPSDVDEYVSEVLE